MRIGELSALTGASERSLRYYEEQLLLRPRRRPSGYRDYTPADVTTVHHVRTLLAAGLNTALIAEILPCMVEDDQRSLVAPCAELRVALEAERDRIDAQIDELLATRALLDTVITNPASAGLTRPRLRRRTDAIHERRHRPDRLVAR